jgi:hypothetical protein
MESMPDLCRIEQNETMSELRVRVGVSRNPHQICVIAYNHPPRCSKVIHTGDETRMYACKHICSPGRINMEQWQDETIFWNQSDCRRSDATTAGRLGVEYWDIHTVIRKASHHTITKPTIDKVQQPKNRRLSPRQVQRPKRIKERPIEPKPALSAFSDVPSLL